MISALIGDYVWISIKNTDYQNDNEFIEMIKNE